MKTVNLTPETIAEFLPSGAFDVTVTDYIARWKTPNSYAAQGWTSDAHFLGGAFLADVLAELPDLKGWIVQDWDHEPATVWKDRVCLTDGKANIWAAVDSYGANAFKRVKIQAYATAAKGKFSSKSVEISVSVSRPVVDIAKDISRRVLPHIDAAKAEAAAKAKAEKDAADLVYTKAASLARRYPNLRILPDVDAGRVRIETKYGAGLHLDAYTYRSTPSGKWRLTCDRGTAFILDDVDAPSGRAFLKLCDKN